MKYFFARLGNNLNSLLIPYRRQVIAVKDSLMVLRHRVLVRLPLVIAPLHKRLEVLHGRHEGVLGVVGGDV